jgi:hypothetical protein
LIASSDIIGKKIIIAGDVNTGKTTLTMTLLHALCAGGLSGRIAVIDMAPDIPPEIAARRGLQGVGGKLAPPPEGVSYFAADIRAPRLTSRTGAEALGVAEENRAKIDGLFDAYGAAGRDILFINDLSIYLQAGRAEDLFRRIETASTVVANGYYGSALGGGALSAHETEEMGKVMAAFDVRVRTPVASIEEALKG